MFPALAGGLLTTGPPGKSLFKLNESRLSEEMADSTAGEEKYSKMKVEHLIVQQSLNCSKINVLLEKSRGQLLIA